MKDKHNIIITHPLNGSDAIVVLDVACFGSRGLGVVGVGGRRQRYLIKGLQLLSVRAVTSPPALGTPKESLGLKHDHTSLQTHLRVVY